MSVPAFQMNSNKPNVANMITMVFAAICIAGLVVICVWNLFFCLIGMTC